jgi:nucleotide-binding universal stress UspA family protein
MDSSNHRSAPTRILVAADTDPASSAAVERAIGLAAALGGELVLLAVVPPDLVDPRYSSALTLVPAEPTGDREAVERMLAHRVAQFSGVIPPDLPSRWVRGYAPAGAAIVHAAEEVDADLVVVAMHRGSEVSHLVRDGTDRHVLHHSPVPVLVVPAP